MGYGAGASRIAGLLIVGAVLTGCGGGSGGTTGPNQTPAIAISLSPTSASVPQGGSATVTATLTRSGGFTGAVTITVTGAPTGVSGTVANPTTSGTTTTATVTVDVASSTTPGTYTLTVTGSGSGVSNATATYTLTVTAVQTGGFGLSATAVSVAQNGNGNSTVTISRTGGFTGSVALSTTSVPAGLTAVFNPTSTATNSSTLTVTASAGITAGSYTIGIKGTATGLADQTASVAVTVTAPSGGGGNAQVNLVCFAPIWVAYQDGNGAWTRATTVSANVFKISVTGNQAGVAWVFPSGGGFQIQVNYFPAAFLTSAATVSLCGTVNLGTKSITGSVTGITGGDRASMSMGGSHDLATTFNLNFALNQVKDGPQDLLGWRHDPNGETGAPVNPDRGFVRRDQNIPHLGTLGAAVDFAGAESFTPATGTMTLPGTLAGEKITHGIQYLTRAQCVSGLLYQTSAGDPNPFVARGFPASVQRADDYHYMFVSAVTGSGAPVIGFTSSRSVAEVFHTMGNRTVTLPASIASAAVTTLAGPYKRLQVVYPNTAEFNQSASFVYTGLTPLRLAAVVWVGSLLSAGPVTIAMPDFTGVNGFDPTWLPATTATGTWSVQTAGSTFPTENTCVEGGKFWSAAALGQF